MSQELIRDLNLQLFAEGGEGGTSGDGATGVNLGVPDQGDLANVKYGKQDATEPTANQPIVEPDKDAEFEKLIKGDYKNEYDKRVQNTIQQRLKGSKETVERYNSLVPTLELLARKYGVDANDIQALNKAIEDDDAYYEDEALEKGVTVEQLKAIKKMERENAELKKQMQEQANRERAEKDVAEWMQQAQDAQRTFPGLDLATELKNPQFLGLLRSGVGVETAYFAVHHKELVPQAMQYTAKQVEQKLTNKILANGNRPTENGATSNSTATVKSDVSQLTKADRAEIIRRVARGEKIKF